MSHILRNYHATVFKKEKMCTVFLSSYRNTSGRLGERKMLWKHKPQASVSTASLKLSLTRQLSLTRPVRQRESDAVDQGRQRFLTVLL